MIHVMNWLRSKDKLTNEVFKCYCNTRASCACHLEYEPNTETTMLSRVLTVREQILTVHLEYEPNTETTMLSRALAVREQILTVHLALYSFSRNNIVLPTF